MSTVLLPLDQFIDSVGLKSAPGRWFVMGQDRINIFADCTEDQQVIHVDQESSKQVLFGTTIAHGFLTRSKLAKMAEDIFVAPELGMARLSAATIEWRRINKNWGEG